MSDDFYVPGSVATEIVRSFSKGIGSLYKPRAIRAIADARSYEIVAIADAETKAARIAALAHSDLESELRERAAQRVVATAMQEQKNLEHIVERAAEMSESSSITSSQIEDDWMTRFIENARSVSDDSVKDLWSLILSNQASIKHLSSLKLLDCVRNLEKIDLEAFHKFMCIKSNWGEITTWKLDFPGQRQYFCPLIDDDALERLLDAGLIHDTVLLSVLTFEPNIPVARVKIAGAYRTIQVDDITTRTLIINGYKLTRIGEELKRVMPDNQATLDFDNHNLDSLDELDSMLEQVKLKLIREDEYYKRPI